MIFSRKLRVSFFLTLILHALLAVHGYAGDPDYPAVFGANWQKADRYINENDPWMRKLSAKYKVDFLLAKSIVFPELVRYSAIRDKMEITLLKALYVNYGADYANFSIGVFQVKPSCAEEILSEVAKMRDRKFAAHFKPLDSKLTIPEKREALIKELENPQSEYFYIIALIKILENKYHYLNNETVEYKLGFFATAYNCGFSNTEDHIRQQFKLKSFYTSLSKPTDCFSYADISVAYFRNSTPKKSPAKYSDSKLTFKNQ